METLGDYLRKSRIRAGMTMRDLGRAAGVDFSLVCVHEKGRYVPEGDTAAKYERALGLPAGALVERVRRERQARRALLFGAPGNN